MRHLHVYLLTLYLKEEGDVEEFKVKKSTASLRMSSGRKLKLPG